MLKKIDIFESVITLFKSFQEWKKKQERELGVRVGSKGGANIRNFLPRKRFNWVNVSRLYIITALS